MSNLEKLDMTNNELKKIPENKLESLTNLKFLILNGNPIDTLYVKSLKSKTKAEIEFNIPEKTKEK